MSATMGNDDFLKKIKMQHDSKKERSSGGHTHHKTQSYVSPQQQQMQGNQPQGHPYELQTTNFGGNMTLQLQLNSPKYNGKDQSAILSDILNMTKTTTNQRLGGSMTTNSFGMTHGNTVSSVPSHTNGQENATKQTKKVRTSSNNPQ